MHIQKFNFNLNFIKEIILITNYKNLKINLYHTTIATIIITAKFTRIQFQKLTSYFSFTIIPLNFKFFNLSTKIINDLLLRSVQVKTHSIIFIKN